MTEEQEPYETKPHPWPQIETEGVLIETPDEFTEEEYVAFMRIVCAVIDLKPDRQTAVLLEAIECLQRHHRSETSTS